MKSLSIITLALTSSIAVFLFLGKTNQSPSAKQAIIKSGPTFQEFVKGFKKKKAPFKVTAEDLKKYYYTDENIANNKQMEIPVKFAKVFPAMNAHQFSRAPMEAKYYYHAKLVETNKYTAVLCISSFKLDTFKGTQRFVTCALVTFDKEGNIIENKRELAGVGENAKGYKTFGIDKDLNISQKTFSKNTTSGDKHVETTIYEISTEGKIVKVKEIKNKK